ncbi:homoserine dehydrogenase [Zavarzinella formosa]|uniref:homoserine dehydrogenase n=1 Tax=Zavarzinella formosa TaxID=360055 RepID=UPI0002D2E3EB|nr:homoserine dehydrogenase [Zavarzinella formosa]
MVEPLQLAMLGGGTVGGGVAKILLGHADRITSRAGRPVQLRHVVVRDPAKTRPSIPKEIISTDWKAAVHDPQVHVVVELMGGTTTAKMAVMEALAAGKHVVTANKALLAEHGAEIFEHARRHERVVAFEASVAGGIPIIGALSQSLTANQVTALQGILNGTSNFILTSMADKGMSYADALKEAQRLGYAEADPTLDVDGSDAAHKLAILVQLAFGVTATLGDIERQGIDGLSAMDLRFAQELGYTVKLLAEAWLEGKEVALHVAPVLLRHTDMLAQVRGAFNAIQIKGDAVGEVLFQGPGAGELPTASSVVGDIIDIAVGRAQRTFAASKLWSGSPQGFVLRPSQGVKSRFYLRVLVADKPGVLADVARVLADEQISIATVIQHEAQEEHAEAVVPLVIMTHYAETGRFRSALDKLNKLPGVVSPGVSYSVDD